MPPTTLAELDLHQLIGRLECCGRHQHLSASRGGGDSSGEVDPGAEPVPVSLDSQSCMDAHSNAWKAVLAPHDLDQLEAESDGVSWMIGADHHRIADGLHLFGAVCDHKTPNHRAELADQVCGLRVPVGFGERCVSSEIGE